MNLMQATKEILKMDKKTLSALGGTEAGQLLAHNDASVIVAQIKKLRVFLDGMETGLKEQAIEECLNDMLPAQIDVDRYGVKLSVVNTGDTLDFESDKEYKDLNDALKDRRHQLSLAYKMSFKGEKLVNGNDEIVPVVPVKIGGKTVLKATVL